MKEEQVEKEEMSSDGLITDIMIEVQQKLKLQGISFPLEEAIESSTIKTIAGIQEQNQGLTLDTTRDFLDDKHLQPERVVLGSSNFFSNKISGLWNKVKKVFNNLVINHNHFSLISDNLSIITDNPEAQNLDDLFQIKDLWKTRFMTMIYNISGKSKNAPIQSDDVSCDIDGLLFDNSTDLFSVFARVMKAETLNFASSSIIVTEPEVSHFAALLNLSEVPSATSSLLR